MPSSQNIKVQGFEPSGQEYMKFEIVLHEADLEVFRELAGLSANEQLLGAFQLSDEQFSSTIECLLKEVRGRNLQMFLAFGED